MRRGAVHPPPRSSGLPAAECGARHRAGARRRGSLAACRFTSEGSAAVSQTLDGVGGGLSVARSYGKGEAMLNASLIVDNPAVAAAQSLFQSNSQVAAQPGWSRLKLGTDDALLRFDAGTRSGEIMIVIGTRVLLEIEGTEIGREDILVEAAKGWNLAVVRRLIGAGS